MARGRVAGWSNGQLKNEIKTLLSAMALEFAASHQGTTHGVRAGRGFNVLQNNLRKLMQEVRRREAEGQEGAIIDENTKEKVSEWLQRQPARD